jgi:proteic killer suppression protein
MGSLSSTCVMKLFDVPSNAANLRVVYFPSNYFEALGGDRQGQYSIRINRQWRICFEWPEGEARPFHIEITDY